MIRGILSVNHIAQVMEALPAPDGPPQLVSRLRYPRVLSHVLVLRPAGIADFRCIAY